MKPKLNLRDDSHLHSNVSDNVMDGTFIAKWSNAAVAAQAAVGELHRSRSKKVGATLERLEIAYELNLEDAVIRFLPDIINGTRRGVCMASYDAEMLALLVQLGFFQYDGRCYTAALPKSTKAADVRRAIVRLVDTEDSSSMLHPCKLLTTTNRNRFGEVRRKS